MARVSGSFVVRESGVPELERAADTSSKVIQQSAGRGLRKKPQPPSIVNNFAAAPAAAVNKVSSSAQADGGNASGVARSRAAYPSKISRRTPARPQASPPRSDRTKAHEALRISSTPGGGHPLRPPTSTTKPMIQSSPLTHYAGLIWLAITTMSSSWMAQVTSPLTSALTTRPQAGGSGGKRLLPILILALPLRPVLVLP